MPTLSASAVFLPWEHRSLPLDKKQSVQSAIHTLKSLSDCPHCLIGYSPKCEMDCRRKYDRAEKVIKAAGLCISCACDGYKSELGKHQPGNAYECAGRECPNCEHFECSNDGYGYEPEYDSYSDADSGL